MKWPMLVHTLWFDFQSNQESTFTSVFVNLSPRLKSTWQRNHGSKCWVVQKSCLSVPLLGSRLGLPLDTSGSEPCINMLTDVFFCLGTQPSQFIKVLNSGILHPYQHVKHKINLTIRPGITWAFLKFLYLVDTDSWRHFLHQLVRFSLAFTLDSFSRTARTRSHVQCWQLSSLGIDLNFRYP